MHQKSKALVLKRRAAIGPFLGFKVKLQCCNVPKAQAGEAGSAAVKAEQALQVDGAA